jgi:hypothetical protein
VSKGEFVPTRSISVRVCPDKEYILGNINEKDIMYIIGSSRPLRV